MGEADPWPHCLGWVPPASSGFPMAGSGGHSHSVPALRVLWEAKGLRPACLR